MASEVRKSRVKEVPLSEVKDDLSRYLREAESHEILITRHGKPPVSSLGSLRRMTGLTTDSKTTAVSLSASPPLETASVMARVSRLRMSISNPPNLTVNRTRRFMLCSSVMVSAAGRLPPTLGHGHGA